MMEKSDPSLEPPTTPLGSRHHQRNKTKTNTRKTTNKRESVSTAKAPAGRFQASRQQRRTTAATLLAAPASQPGAYCMRNDTSNSSDNLCPNQSATTVVTSTTTATTATTTTGDSIENQDNTDTGSLIQAQLVTIYDAVVINEDRQRPSPISENDEEMGNGSSDTPATITVTASKKRRNMGIAAALGVVLAIVIAMVVLVGRASSARQTSTDENIPIQQDNNGTTTDPAPTLSPIATAEATLTPTSAPTVPAATTLPPGFPTSNTGQHTVAPTMAPQAATPSWEQLGPSIETTEAQAAAFFGAALATSRDGLTIAVGEPYYDTDQHSNAGQVHVYKFSTQTLTWYQDTTTVDNLVGQANADAFASSVALSGDGNTLVVGVPGHNACQGEFCDVATGQVRVFVRTGHPVEGWHQMGINEIYGDFWDGLGAAVAVSRDGQSIVAGAPVDAAFLLYPGSVSAFVFQIDTQTWELRGQRIQGRDNMDAFGSAVDMSADGMVLAAGADYYDGTSNENVSGYVQVYSFDMEQNDWVLLGQELQGDEWSDAFGRAISLSADGHVLAVGSRAGIRGKVSVFAYNQTSMLWETMGQRLVGDSLGDEFGVSVSLSAPGDVLAVGATQSANDGTGYVRIYRYDVTTESWIASDAELLGETSGDRMGGAVVLSDNGNTVAIGAVGHNAYAGQVQVHRSFH